MITKKDLPVSEAMRRELQDFWESKRMEGKLVILRGIPDILRDDYLNSSLPFPDRAVKNIGVEPATWRLPLSIICSIVAQEAVKGVDRSRIAVCYPWRAGLAFCFSFFRYKVGKHLHFGLKRDEKEPHKTAEVYLSLTEEKFNGHFDRVVIADPMLATGGSFFTIINNLKELGVTEEKITLASVISAPEGIYNLFQEYPKIKIITAVLDSHLNELGYIQPGLGDAGDKFFDRITINNFNSVKDIFSSAQWELLMDKINEANQN